MEKEVSKLLMIKSNRKKQWIVCILTCVICLMFFGVTIAAAEGENAGNVSTAIQNTWDDAKDQVKTISNNVVFPAIDLVLAILFFVKLATSYFEYRKHGQFEFTPAAILFACLIFCLTAPLYVWDIVGM